MYDNILFLITTPYIYHPESDQNTPISIVKGDIENFDQNVFLGGGVVNCFLRFMSLLSKINSIIDSTSIVMKNLQDDKTKKFREIFPHKI